jgi:hypothetical protein
MDDMSREFVLKVLKDDLNIMKKLPKSPSADICIETSTDIINKFNGEFEKDNMCYIGKILSNYYPKDTNEAKILWNLACIFCEHDDKMEH